MKQVDKTILKLVYGISLMDLHLHYFHADGGGSFGEGGKVDSRRRLRSYKVIEWRVKPQKRK